jgi:hypothetical protein
MRSHPKYCSVSDVAAGVPTGLQLPMIWGAEALGRALGPLVSCEAHPDSLMSIRRAVALFGI